MGTMGVVPWITFNHWTAYFLPTNLQIKLEALPPVVTMAAVACKECQDLRHLFRGKAQLVKYAAGMCVIVAAIPNVAAADPSEVKRTYLAI